MTTEKAYLGGGCFWCLEAVFERIPGILDVTNGYAGGHVSNPTYEQVCSNTTGHAEVVQVQYDAEKLSYLDILEIFWNSHDPTTINRQGADVGSQYRSIILTTSKDQERTAKKSLNDLNETGLYSNPAVTEIVPLEQFYIAEDYHQDYFRNHPDAPYCAHVIQPKLEKLNF